MKRVLLMACFVCTLSTAEAAEAAEASAESGETTPLTAEKAAAMARLIAPEVAAARVGIAIAKAGIRSTYAFAYPNVSAKASYTKASLDYQEVPVFGNVAFNRENEYRTGISIDQFVYAYDRLGASRDAENNLLKVSQHDVTLTQRDMAFLARRAFEDVRQARARLRIATIRVEQRTGEHDDARALFAAGRASITDANLAEIVLAQAQDELVAAQAHQESTLIQLAAFIGVERPALPAIQEEPISRPDFTVLLANAHAMISSAGEPVSYDLQQRYEDAMSRLRNSQTLPELGVRATYGADGSTYDNLDDNWTASVALTWNLYDGGNNFALSEQAAQRSRQLRLQRAASLRDRHTKLEQARSDSRSLLERITLADKIIDIAKANYEDARSQYRAGRLTMTQVGDSSFRLTEAYYRLLTLRYQEALLGHDLERLAE